MPDPVDPTPVRVVARGGKHFVVDKHGKALKKQGGYSTPEAASAVASSVNATWRDAKAERKAKGGPAITEAAESRAAIVLKVVGEKAKEDAKPKPKQQAETERALPPPVVLPPPEPDPPVLSSALGKQMDDFVNAQPGDRVSLDGGHVIRSTKGFVSRRHGQTEMETHATPHEAAQHLIATIQSEAHASRLARHSERQAAQDAVADQHAAAHSVREERLEESIAVPHVGVPTMLHFDPRLHRRDRLGKFQDMLSKLERQPHGSTLHLPHGIAVRRSVAGLEVSGGGPEKTLRSSHAAAGEALHRHVQGEVGRGADFRHESGLLLEDLAQARRAAAAEDPGGAFHLDSRMAETRRERGRKFQATRSDSHRGRSNESERRFAETHGAGTDPKVGAANLERAAARARRSGGRAKTGAEIDDDARMRGFYQRQYDENGNQTTGRWNEAMQRLFPDWPYTKAAQSAPPAKKLAGRKNEPVPWTDLNPAHQGLSDWSLQKLAAGKGKEAKQAAAMLKHRANTGRKNEPVGKKKHGDPFAVGDRVSAGTQAGKITRLSRGQGKDVAHIDLDNGDHTQLYTYVLDHEGTHYTDATGRKNESLSADEKKQVEELRAKHGDRAAQALEASLRATKAYDKAGGGEFTADAWSAGLTELFGRKNEPIDKPFERGQAVRLKKEPYTGGKVNQHYGGGSYSVRFVGEKESRMVQHHELRAQKTGADVVGTNGPKGLSNKFGRKNEPLRPKKPPVRPGVSITHAADSDRGEIDVNATDTKDNWHEGGRYEREDLWSAQQEAEGLAALHGVEVVDEVGGQSHRRHESPEAAALRVKWEKHFKKR